MFLKSLAENKAISFPEAFFIRCFKIQQTFQNMKEQVGKTKDSMETLRELRNEVTNLRSAIIIHR